MSNLLANRLFLRQAEVIVGTKVQGTNAAVEPQDAKLIKTRIKFSVDKQSETTPNKAKIGIYNLSQDTRNLFEKENVIVFLKAGYEGSLSTIFFGDLNKGQHDSSGADIITNIECGDGELAIKNAIVNIGLKAGATNRQAISAAIEQLNLTRGFSEDIPLKTYLNGFTFSGRAEKLLTDLLKQVNLTWNIQDGELIIIGPSSVTTQDAVLITPSTGLIGSPTKTPQGVEFSCLLNPAIRPGRAIKLESKQFQGAFGSQANTASSSLIGSGAIVKCRRVVHEGDTHEGTWLSKVECTAVEGLSG